MKSPWPAVFYFQMALLCLIFTPSAYAETQTIDHLLQRVEAALATGDYDAALHALEEASNTSTSDASSNQSLARSYVVLAREAVYRSDGLTAFRICQVARERFPAEPSILTQWGKAALAVEKSAQEVLGATASTLSLTGNQSSNPEIVALHLALLGTNLTKMQDRDILGNPVSKKATLSQGITKLQDAIKSDPQWFLPHFLLGRIYADQNDHRRAIESYEKGLAKNPLYFNPVDYLLLGNLYNDGGEFKKTKELLKTALAQSPYLPGVHYTIAQAEAGLKDPTEEYYQICYELFIGGPEGLAFKQAQQAKMQLLQRYLTEEGREKYPELWFCLEAAHRGAAKQWIEAASLLEQAAILRSNPHPILHLLAGEAHWQAGQLDVALNHLNKVVAIDPHFPPAYAEIGDIYEQKGDLIQAKLWWEKALKTDLNNWKIQELRKRFAKQSNPAAISAAGE